MIQRKLTVYCVQETLKYMLINSCLCCKISIANIKDDKIT